jgi:antitoxin VapB
LHAGLQTTGGLRWFKPIMALNFKDKETEKLAAEIATLTGESEEEVVRQSLRERRDRIEPQAVVERKPKSKGEMLRFLETEVWPLIPEEHRGRPPMTKAERAKLLGYGPDE